MVLVLIQMVFYGCRNNREVTFHASKEYMVKISTLYDPLDVREKFYCEVFNRKGDTVVSMDRVFSTTYGDIDLKKIKGTVKDSVLTITFDDKETITYELRKKYD